MIFFILMMFTFDLKVILQGELAVSHSQGLRIKQGPGVGGFWSANDPLPSTLLVR